jgi:hypothetical protein
LFTVVQFFHGADTAPAAAANCVPLQTIALADSTALALALFS